MFNPSERNQVPQIILGTGQQIIGDIARALQNAEERKRQAERTRGLVGVLGAAGDGTRFDLGHALSLIRGSAESPERVGGAISGLQIISRLLDQNQQNQLQRDQLGFEPTPTDFDRAEKAGYSLLPTGHGRFRAVPTNTGGPTEPAFSPTPEQLQQAEAVGLKWLPTSRGQGRWVEDPNNPANQPKNKTAPGDSWEALNNDVYNATGSHLGDWNTASNQRIEGDRFIADNSTAGKTLQMPVHVYQKFLTRFNALQNGGSSPATPAVPASGGSEASPAARVDSAIALSQARAKIQAGADPALVRQRLQQLGVDPSGL